MTTIPAPPRTHVPPSPDDVAADAHRRDLESWMPAITGLVFALGVIVGHGSRLLLAVCS